MTKKKQDCEFKSARELGLSQKEWEALIQTLIALEHNQIKHVLAKDLTYKKGDNSQREGHRFNMAIWNESYDCGSVCCLGGSAELLGKLPEATLSGKATNLRDADRPALFRLFYPGTDSAYGPSDWNSITPRQAAKALRGYLTTGETVW